MKRACYIGVLLFGFLLPAAAQQQLPRNAEGSGRSPDHPVLPRAWRISQPLGNRYRVSVDTLMLNYYDSNLPSSFSVAEGVTGALGSPTYSKIFFDRPETPEFIFIAPFRHEYRTPSNFDFFNSRLPVTQVSYFTGGPKISATDHLDIYFSGNVNRRLAIGAAFDYVFARGYYDRQATKDLSYQIFGSYIGNRYELQVFLNTLNFVVQENGGITDDNYILRPEDMQGGQNQIDTRNIPVNLTKAYNRVRGKIYYATQRYNLGYEKETQIEGRDTAVFVPVSSIIHTIQYTENRRRFIAENTKIGGSGQNFFEHSYFDRTKTNDTTSWWSLSNTVGLSLREGFNKYAKAGLAAFVTYDIRRFHLMGDTVPGSGTAQGLYDRERARDYTENRLFVGGELSKQQGKILTYNLRGQVGLLGNAVGEIDVTGNIRTRIPLGKRDTVQVRAYGFFRNREPSFYLRNYVSNHFIWHNDFDKERRFRVGGEISLPRWGTRINVGTETLQNYVYFGPNGKPRQQSSAIQVFSAELEQKLRWGVLNFDNQIVYQKTSNPSVLPLPELSLHSNLYLLFRIAKVLHVQFGVDCRYYTSYYSDAYQPATLSFHTQNETKVGDYPLMNAYVNMKLKQARFFVLFSHVNKGLFGSNNYFSLPHYPLDPRMFSVGISIDFVN